VAERLFRDKNVEHAAIFDDISNQAVAAYKGSENSVSLPFKDYSGMTITHNHPGEWGRTLSVADISFMAETNAKSMRAVGRLGEGGLYINTGKKREPVRCCLSCCFRRK
jgi:hypothetical protein